MTWPKVPLDDVADIVSGATPKTGVAEYWDGDIPWVTPADLSSLESVFIGATPRMITAAGLASCATSVLPERSVLLSSRAPIGLVAINTVPMTTNQGFKSLVPRADVAAPEYLYHWLKANTSYLQSLGNGATFKEVSKSTVARIEVPLPPLDEQRRIVAILDQADSLRRRRVEVVRLTAALRQAIFQHIFGQTDRREALGSIIDSMRNGVSPSKSGTVRAQVLTLSAVTSGQFDPTASKEAMFAASPAQDQRVSTEDFLICRGNGNRALVGVGVHPAEDRSDLVFPDTVIAARFDASRVDPAYLEAAWSQPATRRQIESVARTTNGTFKVNQQSLSGVTIPLPSIEKQQRYSRVVSTIRQPTTSQLDELFASLQSRAFSGQL